MNADRGTSEKHERTTAEHTDSKSDENGVHGGIRVDLRVGSPGDCPVAQASAEPGSHVREVVWTGTPTRGGRITEESVVESEDALSDRNLTELYAVADRRVYRFGRPASAGCVCKVIEQFGVPVTNVDAIDGTLSLTLHVPDADADRSIVEALKESYEDVPVRSLAPVGEELRSEFVLIDRARLTDRQQEVLERANELGYFAYPKRANAGEVAAALDIAPSTFSEHLAAAQGKLVDALFETTAP